MMQPVSTLLALHNKGILVKGYFISLTVAEHLLYLFVLAEVEAAHAFPSHPILVQGPKNPNISLFAR